jgi:hypothetical protein
MKYFVEQNQQIYTKSPENERKSQSMCDMKRYRL